MRPRALFLAALVALALAASSAGAFTFQFQASVTSLDFGQSQVSVGDIVSGTIFFDTELAGGASGDAFYLTLYPYQLGLVPGGEVQMAVGMNVLGFAAGLSLNFGLQNAATDLFTINGVVLSPVFGPGEGAVFEIVLRDAEGQGIPSGGVPLSLDLADFSDDQATLSFCCEQGFAAELTSLTYVPEPAVAALLGIAGVVALPRRGRR